jgi:hypothetical protein
MQSDRSSSERQGEAEEGEQGRGISGGEGTQWAQSEGEEVMRRSMSMGRRSGEGIEGEETGECFVAELVVWMLRQHRFVMHVEPGWLSSGDEGQGLETLETVETLGTLRWW